MCGRPCEPEKCFPDLSLWLGLRCACLIVREVAVVSFVHCHVSGRPCHIVSNAGFDESRYVISNYVVSVVFS